MSALYRWKSSNASLTAEMTKMMINGPHVVIGSTNVYDGRKKKGGVNKYKQKLSTSFPDNTHKQFITKTLAYQSWTQLQQGNDEEIDVHEPAIVPRVNKVHKY